MPTVSWKIGAGLAAALAIVLAITFSVTHVAAGQFPEAATIGQNVTSFQELTDRFQTLAREKGAVYAYDVLRIAPVPPGTDLHLLGHSVGDILYQQEGIDGIKECTQDFRNACSHSIVIGTLNEFGSGETTIEKIRAACKLAPGGTGAYTMCFHGLGHGVFAYFGYDMPKAVAFCKRLGTPEYGDQEFTQCVGGMIMELIDGGGHDHDLWTVANGKYLDPKDPLAPCDTSLIPDEAKSFCYMYLTPHLFSAAGAELASPDPSTFPKAFSYCTPIRDASLRDVCYSSFGKEFVPLAGARDIRSVDAFSNDQYRLAIQWCMMAPGEKAQEDCLSQALASVFWGGENNPQASFRFCSLTPTGDIQDDCYKQLGTNIASFTQGDQRTQLCEQLPADDVESCKTQQIGPAERP